MSNLKDLVVEDLRELQDVFEPIDGNGLATDIEEAVELPAPFEEGVNRSADVDGTDEPTAVWTYRGRHRAPFLGFAPTGAEVVISGVTIFRRPSGEAGHDWDAHRIINWLDVLSQIGVTLHHRTVPQTLD